MLYQVSLPLPTHTSDSTIPNFSFWLSKLLQKSSDQIWKVSPGSRQQLDCLEIQSKVEVLGVSLIYTNTKTNTRSTFTNTFTNTNTNTLKGYLKLVRVEALGVRLTSIPERGPAAKPISPGTQTIKRYSKNIQKVFKTIQITQKSGAPICLSKSFLTLTQGRETTKMHPLQLLP